MKRIILLAVLLLTALTASAQSGKSIYQKYSDAENVSAVYISPAMFRLIGKIPDLEVGENHVNLAPSSVPCPACTSSTVRTPVSTKSWDRK